MLRRPLVVYEPDLRPDPDSGAHMHGVYLPALWGAQGLVGCCSREPLCLLYTRGAGGLGHHFTALACPAGTGPGGLGPVAPLVDHVSAAPLPLRCPPCFVFQKKKRLIRFLSSLSL